MGFGIDENTAMFVQDSSFQVIGPGSVYIFDVGSASGLKILENGKATGRFGVKNVKVSMLTKLDQYNFNTKSITWSPKKNLRVKKRPAITTNDLFSTANPKNFFDVTTELFRDTDSDSTYGVTSQDYPQFWI